MEWKCVEDPLSSHFLFVDDYFLFCKTNINESQCLKDILDTYGRASGQLINYQKSKKNFLFQHYNNHQDQYLKLTWSDWNNW